MAVTFIILMYRACWRLGEELLLLNIQYTIKNLYNLIFIPNCIDAMILKKELS
jgi:hypothetical protein